MRFSAISTALLSSIPDPDRPGLSANKSAPDEPSIQILLAKVYKALGDSAPAAADARFKQLLQEEHTGAEKHAADVIQANQ